MFIRTFPTLRVQLQAFSTTELFTPLTRWHHSLEAATVLACVVVLTNKNGNFQCRLGVQTATSIIEEVNDAVNPSSASAQITMSPSRRFIRFNPNGAAEGNIDAAAYFRVGILYSLSTGTVPGQGDVRIQGLCWR